MTYFSPPAISILPSNEAASTSSQKRTQTTEPSEKPTSITKTDHWSADAYSASASFVHDKTVTHKLLSYLSPQPTDNVLDIGCGDGKFTSNYASSVSSVLGVDLSPSFIESARKDFSGSNGNGNVKFILQDCARLETCEEVTRQNGTFSKVVSNAALHWILRDPKTRQGTLQACHDALAPGGLFAFEMGGKGNVAEVHAALIAALMHHGGMGVVEAREKCQWFFPSDASMREALEGVGFQVEVCELEYRPTKLTEGEKGGLEGWVRLMGGGMLEGIEDVGKREAAIKEICEVLETVVTREEDGSKYLGYVRLRGLARKPQKS